MEFFSENEGVRLLVIVLNARRGDHLHLGLRFREACCP